MNDGALAEPHAWTPRRRWTVTALAVVAQVALISWFSDKTPFRPRAADAHPVVQLVALARSELLTLADPTLFTMAHPDGFSGRAWLAVPPHEYRPSETAAAPQWLMLTPENLGAAFREFVKTNHADSVTVTLWQAPTLTQPDAGSAAIMPPVSMLRVAGALAKRGLLSAWQLPAWPAPDLLEPSVVQVLVDARGNPISATLLSSSGLKAADQHAVELARSALFGAGPAAPAASANDPENGLVSGRLIFQWHTLAPAANSIVNPR